MRITSTFFWSLRGFPGGASLAESPSVEHRYGWYPGVTLTVIVLSGVHHIPWVQAGKPFEEMTRPKIKVVEFPFSALYDKFVTETNSPQWLQAIQKSMTYGVSDLPIPGGFSYYDALVVEVGEALAGKKTTEEVLNDRAKACKKIIGV